MSGARLDVFKGIRPRVSPRLLPVGEAQVAQNTNLGSGTVQPWHGHTAEEATAGAGTQTIYRMHNGGNPLWLQFDGDVDVARGPVPDDALERTYYTGLTEPRMTYLGIVEGSNPPDDYRKLGIPAPETAPAIEGGALPDDAVTGTISGSNIISPTMKADFVVEDEENPILNYNCGWVFGDRDDEDDPGAPHVFEFNLPVGTTLRVESVVDDDHVTLADANGGQYIAETTERNRVNVDRHSLNKVMPVGQGTADIDGFFRFYIPNDITVNIEGHGLQAGDVIRITSVSAQIAVRILQPQDPINDAAFYGQPAAAATGPWNVCSDTAVYTWGAYTTKSGDGFYYAGRKAWPFVDVYVDTDGAASESSFDFEGEVGFQLIERAGVPYEDIATDIESRAYVYTYVSELGEEGPPSPVSNTITIRTGSAVTVSDFAAPPSDQRSITHIRIYRANTGSQITAFQFVDEIADPFDDYTDEASDFDLGVPLQTESWEPPPENLRGIVALPNGVMAGFVGKTLHLSEPNFPHAWPPEYKKPVDHEIVGLGVLPNGVAVLTRGAAYMAVGDHPRSMSLRHFSTSQPCVSKRSIASTIDSVIYASPDGLASIGAGGFRLLTEGRLDKDDWQELNPSEVIGFWHDSRYFGFNSAGGFVFSPRDETVGLSTLGFAITCGYLDVEDDTLYAVLTTDTDNIYSLFTDDESPLEATWKSGVMLMPYPLNPAAARVVASAYPVTFNLYDAEGELRGTRSVPSSAAFRLPGGYLTDAVSLEVVTSDTVYTMHIGESIDELVGG